MEDPGYIINIGKDQTLVISFGGDGGTVRIQEGRIVLREGMIIHENSRGDFASAWTAKHTAIEWSE